MLLLLCLAAFVAAAISGTAGFGGALLLLPILSLAVGPVQAAPLLTVAQLIGNLSRMLFGFRDIHWRPVALFLAAALPCAVAGAWCLGLLPPAWVMRGIGVVLIAFALARWRGWLRMGHSGGAWLVGGGGLTGFLSGLAGSAGPLGAATFLALELPPVAYIASEAVTALAMHAVKLAVYRRFTPFDAHFWTLALALGAAVIAGTWVSRRLAERLPVAWFRGFITILLAAVGLFLAITGGR
jgi:uncharacterized membrane protein YfcA